MFHELGSVPIDDTWVGCEDSHFKFFFINNLSRANEIMHNVEVSVSESEINKQVSHEHSLSGYNPHMERKKMTNRPLIDCLIVHKRNDAHQGYKMSFCIKRAAPHFFMNGKLFLLSCHLGEVSQLRIKERFRLCASVQKKFTWNDSWTWSRTW